MQFRCYICDDPLVAQSSTDPGNLTEEYIILNAIGGRLKSKNLLCKPCNDKLGSRADAALAAQLDSICSLLQITRDRGTINNIRGKTQEGEEYILEEGYKPRPAIPTRIIEETGPKQSKINLSAGTTKEMRQMLMALKRKFPTFDAEAALSKVIKTAQYIQEPIHLNLTVGGEPAFRSIAKSAINFYVYHGGDRQNILQLLPYVGGAVVIDIVFHANHLQAVLDRLPGEALHLLHVKGDPNHKLLYGYAEYFSVFSFIICLSTEYKGEAFAATYGIDPQTGQRVEKKVVFALTPAEIHKLKDYPISGQWPILKERLGKVMQIVDKKHTGFAIDNMINRITEETFNGFAENANLTENEMRKYNEMLVGEWMKFAYSRPPKTH